MVFILCILASCNSQLNKTQNNAVSVDTLKANDEHITNRNSSPNSNPVYAVVDTPAIFPGGEGGLLDFYKNNSIKAIAKKGEKYSEVVYQLIIDKDGSPAHINILSYDDEKLIDVTVRLVNKMPRWRPAIKDGKAVKMSKILDIRYALDN